MRAHATAKSKQGEIATRGGREKLETCSQRRRRQIMHNSDKFSISVHMSLWYFQVGVYENISCAGTEIVLMFSSY